MAHKYYSNGKLLLTGEYAILDGATGLAVPTKFGQSLEVFPQQEGILTWKSFDYDNTLWFEAELLLDEFKITTTSDLKIAQTLVKILKGVKTQNSTFFQQRNGHRVETKLGFPRNWGLGTSSTLINNMASWANVDAHKLLSTTIGGSGYDIACASHFKPLLYRLDLGQPKILPVIYDPPFKEALFFVHLNKKQNSREAIKNYRRKAFNKTTLLTKIDAITHQFLEVQRIEELESLIIEHEMALSSILGLPPIKRQFPDYFGAIKSLGAWGGDFILATGNEKTPDYFKARGFETVISFSDMVL